jgi:hypothetical protein
VYCEGLKYDLNKRIFRFFGSIIEQTPLTHLNEIMSDLDAHFLHGWTVGTVTPTETITIQYNYDTILAALEKIRQATGYDLEFTNAKVVNLKTVGNQSSTSTIEWQKNLKSLRRERIIPEVTRMFGIGGEGNNAVPMTIEKATHRITAINGNDHTMDSAKIASSGNDWGTFDIENVDTGFFTTISSSSKQVGGNDIINFADSSLVGERLRFIGATSAGLMDNIYDKVKYDAYGTRDGVFRDENFSDAINLIGPYNSSALSGTYTAGLCEGWTAIGSPTLTENTNVAFVMNGSKSQKVVVAAFSSTIINYTAAAQAQEGEMNGSSYSYKVAWVTTDGEGPLSIANTIGSVLLKRVLITLVDSPHALATHWRIYRTKGTGGTYYFIADVPVAQTTFYDTLGDDKFSVVSPGNTAAGGQGIQRTFTAVVGKEYASLVWIFVESGRVRIELEAGTIIPEKELGTNRATPVVASTTKFIVKTEGLVATATAGKIRVVAHEGAATFYVDSAVVVDTAYAPNSDKFVADNGATELWYATFDELQRKKVVAEKISLSAVDIYETAAFAGTNKISVGDLITVIDTKLGINTSVRVVKKSFDLLQPWNAQFEVNTAPDRFTSDYSKRIQRENTIGSAYARQASRMALATRNILGSTNQPVIEISQIES